MQHTCPAESEHQAEDLAAEKGRRIRRIGRAGRPHAVAGRGDGEAGTVPIVQKESPPIVTIDHQLWLAGLQPIFASVVEAGRLPRRVERGGGLPCGKGQVGLGVDREGAQAWEGAVASDAQPKGGMQAPVARSAHSPEGPNSPFTKSPKKTVPDFC